MQMKYVFQNKFRMITRNPGTTSVCFTVVNDEHRKPGFKLSGRVKFKEGSGLKATGSFVILLSKHGFERDSQERKSSLSLFRSSRMKLFLRIGVFRNSPIFTGKHLRWSLFLISPFFKRDFNTDIFLGG